MISDFSRRTYLVIEAIKRRFSRPPPLSKDYSQELMTIFTQISENQKRLKEVLVRMKDDAQALQDELQMEEFAQLQERKKDHENWLTRAGIDPSCVDEFMQNPSLEVLDDLRRKYPLLKK